MILFSLYSDTNAVRDEGTEKETGFRSWGRAGPGAAAEPVLSSWRGHGGATRCLLQPELLYSSVSPARIRAGSSELTLLSLLASPAGMRADKQVWG